MLNLLRRVRHDFGNHLQVIMGYIDLGKPEEAKQYIKSLVALRAAERILFDKLEPGASLYFYEQLLSARDLGVILTYEEMKIDDYRLFADHEEPGRSLPGVLGQYDRRADEDPVILVTIRSQGGQGEMIFSGPGLEPVQVSIKE